MAAARIAASLLAICAFALSAQQGPYSHVQIRVTDFAVEPVAGAEIRMATFAGQPEISGVTNRNGLSRFALGPGSYTLEVTARGFEKWFRKVEVQNVADLLIDAKLEALGCSKGMICDDVEVIPDRIDLQVDSPIAEITIPFEHAQTLPIIPQSVHKKRAAATQMSVSSAR